MMNYDDWKTQAPDDAAEEIVRRQPLSYEPSDWQEWDAKEERDADD